MKVRCNRAKGCDDSKCTGRRVHTRGEGMKTAEEWAKECLAHHNEHPVHQLLEANGFPDPGNICPFSIATIRAIQADALRWAAEQTDSDTSVPAYITNLIQDTADRIERGEPK